MGVQRQQAIVDTVMKDPAVESVTHYIGPGGPTPTLNQGRVFVVLKPLAERGVISRYAVPARIVIADALPRTSVGKLDKKALRARYWTDSDRLVN